MWVHILRNANGNIYWREPRLHISRRLFSLYIYTPYSCCCMLVGSHCQCCFFIQPSDRLHTARVCSVMAIIQHPFTVRETGKLCRFVYRVVIATVFRWGFFFYDQKPPRKRREESVCSAFWTLSYWTDVDVLAGRSSQTPCLRRQAHTPSVISSAVSVSPLHGMLI